MYALRAMGYLADHKHQEPILTQVISEQTGIPKNFLSKILHRLVQGGLIQSVRGRRGGFVLARPGSEITLKEVLGLFMRLEDFQRCFLGFDTCDGSCGLHHKWQHIARQFEKMLQETTVHEIASHRSSVKTPNKGEHP